MSYTKGKWTAYKDDLTRDSYAVDLPHKPHDKVYTEVAIVFGAANALLIASAPDMYEALKAIVDGIDGGTERLGAGRETAIRKALAKVEGK